MELETKKERKKKEKKKKVIKAPKVQTIFCIISLVFIIGCFVFYGMRLVKYYRVYNPKSSTGETLMNLSSFVTSSSSIVYEGDGLYISNGNYIYKGSNVNNYIIVSNMLFRIVRINSDKSIDIVLDDYINKLSFDEIVEFEKSNIYEYLNNKFLNNIDESLLVQTVVCKDLVSNLSEVTCNDISTNSYVRLLGVSDYLNSISDNNTYLGSLDDYWLYNYDNDNIWYISGSNISKSKPSNSYGVKPVITLKNTNAYLSGDGSINNPYQIMEDEGIKVGTYLDMGDDVYVVYEIGDDYYKIQSNSLLTKKQIFDETSNDYKESSLKEYLESYVNSLSYKDLLKEITWENEVKSRINILTLDDLKFNSSLKDYFLRDKLDNNICLYNTNVLSSKVKVKHSVRFSLGLSKDIKIISGNGSSLAPFIVEV